MSSSRRHKLTRLMTSNQHSCLCMELPRPRATFKLLLVFWVCATYMKHHGPTSMHRDNADLGHGVFLQALLRQLGFELHHAFGQHVLERLRLLGLGSCGRLLGRKAGSCMSSVLFFGKVGKFGKDMNLHTR